MMAAATVLDLIFLCFLSLCFATEQSWASNVRHCHFSVGLGQMVYLASKTLGIKEAWLNEVCKVEVAEREPMTQRVGQLRPKIFDCAFPSQSVAYTHYGSPSLSKDLVHLRIFYFAANNTRIEVVHLHIIVESSPHLYVTIKRHLRIKDFFGLSRPIDHRVLEFSNKSSICRVGNEDNEFTAIELLPSYGRLVTGRNRQPLLEVIEQSCALFVHWGLRYEHTKPPTPNVDFVAIFIRTPIGSKFDVFHEEWLQLKVTIEPGFVNLPPLIDSSSTFLLEGCPLSRVQVTTKVLSAKDEESPTEKLMFALAKSSSENRGNFYHISDPSWALSSFRQVDLKNDQILYHLPMLHPPVNDSLTFQLELDIIDTDFLHSASPAILRVMLRHCSWSISPWAAVNSGLILYEGQRRQILPNNFHVFPELPLMKFTVLEGPKHGRVTVSGHVKPDFTWSDLRQGLVWYAHDDSDTTDDAVYFGVAHGSLNFQLKYPISIIPKDDSAPQLIVNLGVSVGEGKFAILDSRLLLATDYDSPDDAIVYVIVQPPSAGHILQRHSDRTFGRPVTNFTQSNLRKSLVIYVHNKGEILFDDFELVLRDGKLPVANESPRFRVMVNVIAAPDADPPRVAAQTTLCAFVNETDVLFLTRTMLHYVDRNINDDDIVYQVTSQPRPISDYTLTDGGKLIILDLRKDSTKKALLHAAEITEFSQKHIDHSRVVYVPPLADIGATLLDVSFMFSVSDNHGNGLHQQHFNITVLPVNNKKPTIVAHPLVVEEGNSSVISNEILVVYDPDTPSHDLDLWLQSLPICGTLTLGTSPLIIGQIFTMNDVQSSRIRYYHNGAKVFEDHVAIMVSDQVHSVSHFLDIKIQPLDRDAEISLNADGFVGLSISEGDGATITQEVLSSLDLATNASNMEFVVIEDPQFGELLIEGKPVRHFSMRDVTNGRLQYFHDGQEIGPHSKFDDLNFAVFDGKRPYVDRGRAGGTDPALTLRITILPIDNVPPRLHCHQSLLVIEGGKKALESRIITVTDEDSPSGKIIIVVNVQPKYGFLENSKFLPGSEISGVDKRIGSFALSDLKSGSISYVQAIHRKLEPKSDSFSLYAFDGVQRSAEIQCNISVLPQNDEEPEVWLQNFTISHGSSKLIDAEIFAISDLDRPSDNITVFLKVPPIHGKLIVGEGALTAPNLPHHRRRQFMTYLSWQDFDKLGVVYHHDGLTTRKDHFTFMVEDGVHKVLQSSVVSFTRTLPLLVEVVMNKVLKGVTPGSRRLLTNDTLLAKGATQSVSYEVRHKPHFGRLQRLVNLESPEIDSSWNDMSNGTNAVFSQFDVNDGRIRYVLGDVLFERKTIDNFTFVLLQEKNVSRLHLFKIEIVPITRIDPNVTFGIIVVQAKGFAVISPSIVSINRERVIGEFANFHLVYPPKNGHLAHIQSIDLPIHTFSLVDLLGQQVVYVHNPLSHDAEAQVDFADCFQIMLVNDLTKKQNLSLAEVSVHVQPSRLMLTNSLQSCNVKVSAHWIIDGKSMIGHLTSKEVHASHANCTFLVTELPRLGHLLVGNQILGFSSSRRSIFTQAEIDGGFVSYRRQKFVSGDSDHFVFRLLESDSSENANNGYDYRLDIIIVSLHRQAFKLELQSPTTLEDLGNGQQGFVFTSRHIKVLSLPAVMDEFNLNVRKAPRYGKIVRFQSEGKFEDVSNFTTADVNNGLIRYVLNGTTSRSTIDTFELSVTNSDGATIALNSMELEWSLVYFGQTEYDVCEDVGMVGIAVHRTSRLEHSTFVDIEVIPSSAEAQQDFRETGVKQIFFEPGATTVMWEIQIQDDGLEEDAVEMFLVRLRNPINAVVITDDEVIVRVHDKKKGTCFQSFHNVGQRNDHSSTTTPKDHLPVGCGTATVGMSMRITYDKVNFSLICDGKSWVPTISSPEVSIAMKASLQRDAKGERRKKTRRRQQKTTHGGLSKVRV